MKKKKTLFGKAFALLIISIAIIGIRYYNLSGYFTLEYLSGKRELISAYYNSNPLQLISVYFLIYVISTAISIPGALILTLAGGAIFGNITGTIIVSFASTLGATLSFLFSRYMLRDFVQEKFKDKLIAINKGIEEEGAFYLFTLRMIPYFPFFLINLVMGLTKISLGTYFIVSQVGMLAGTFVYVNAGTQLGQLHSLKGIINPNLAISLSLLGIVPVSGKWIIGYIRKRKFISKFRKPESFDYNLVVIGGGAAGLVSAYIAATVKAKVLLIENKKMGGDCLNTGCVPSKALIATAKKMYDGKHSADFGISSMKTQFNFSYAMNRVHRIIKEVEPHDSAERYTNLGADCLKGFAKILSPYEVEINGKVVTTRDIIIATGAEPIVPQIPGIEKIRYLTSETLWKLKKLPKKFLVLGGGPIGCELAQCFSRLGSKVSIIEMGAKILSKEDDDVSELISVQFGSEGIQVFNSHRATGFQQKGKRKFLVCEAEKGNAYFEFDEILIAIGRKPRLKNFGLEQLDMTLTDSGTIQCDEYMRTNYPNIYACGDVAGPYQFTHTASHQAWYASVNALFSPLRSFKADYRVIPWSTFTDPEVARVGLSESDAIKVDIAHEVTKYSLSDLDRAITDGTRNGFVKVITKKGSDKILGVTIVGSHSGDLISEFVLAMKNGIGLNKILGTIHIYPTMAEGNKYAAGVWKKNHAPEKILAFVRKFHAWRRN